MEIIAETTDTWKRTIMNYTFKCRTQEKHYLKVNLIDFKCFKKRFKLSNFKLRRQKRNRKPGGQRQ